MGPRLHRKIIDDKFLLMPMKLLATVIPDPYKDTKYSHQALCWDTRDQIISNNQIIFLNRNTSFTVNLTDYSKYHLKENGMVLSTVMHNEVDLLRPWIEYHKRLGF